jgi:hypothetical protein
MRTFLQKQVSSSFTRSNTAISGPNHQASPLLHLRRSIGNQAAQGMLQGRAEELEAGSTSVAASHFGHDFSRIPVHGNAPPNTQLRPMEKSLGDYEGIAAPPTVHKALHSSSQALDPAMRGFMESRFGHDFSRVRIHTDARAYESADALRARAYTIGDDIVFSRGAYAPGTGRGRFLLAHELAHVVQQRNIRPSLQAKLEIGDPFDRAEHEADAVAHAALATTHMPQAEAVRYIPRISAQSLSHPVLRRVPQDTWGGTFDTDRYKLLGPEPDKSGGSRYGIDIQISFKPNDKVDAEKIALVQTAQTLLDGKPVSVHADKKNDVTPSRMIPEFESGQGTHIDAQPESRTPLYGMADPTKGNELADSGTGRLMQLGSRRPGVKPENAIIVDRSGLSVPNRSEGSQLFETTALAIAGAQKGAFYGSVQWGWKKSADEKKATPIEFLRYSKDVPSSEFKQAAELWNASKTSEGKDTIDLPLTSGMYTSIKKGQLMDKPSKGRSLGNLDLNTRLEVTEQTDPKFPDWGNVIVIDGPLTGKVGWVQRGILSSSITIELKPKKPRK